MIRLLQDRNHWRFLLTFYNQIKTHKWVRKDWSQRSDLIWFFAWVIAITFHGDEHFLMHVGNGKENDLARVHCFKRTSFLLPNLNLIVKLPLLQAISYESPVPGKGIFTWFWIAVRFSQSAFQKKIDGTLRDDSSALVALCSVYMATF